MKIDAASKASAAYAPQAKAARRDEPARAEGSGEKVAINPLSGQLQAAAAEPAFDAAKVDAIRAAISAGEYRVNADAIADGLIATARDLIGRP
ncbi:flagellar biosynthesis anti-sigma factor FlgM [Crenobacter intestini]|uniref:Negative regulator of flagellin synthesis n=1 Tax=Crenobacter intestini TaxID=2563443 RepID=A0A4T0UKM2_9NEIS|nr:flagellar biosynthesis anti-sigma factor FlgM [Crenobacter intestini]TIC79199.1 flagellar biosynthesis anti-sigma factor FlgM [Crenobacter intestini]